MTEPDNASEDRATTSISNGSAKKILELLKSGDEKIHLGSHHDAVLILGNTGSGKTTFTQFIAGDNDDMISTEVGENSSEYIITDLNNKISVNSTVISKTTFPELVVDSESKTAYIDNPGFNDSRNEAYDIAAAYFIKKVLDTVKNVKIVLAVSYPSLRKGVSRSDFLQLLEHITVLLKNIDKYTDSIALVATKVDNAYIKRKGDPVLLEDNIVIENIANFLKEVRESLQSMLSGGETYISDLKRVESKLFYEKAINLLDALLTKKDSKYTRLGIFRRPDEAGKISEIKLLQKGKKAIKNMINKNLRYLPIDKKDIGYTVSDKSKNVIRDLVVEINKNIASNTALISDDFITYYRDVERKMFADDMYTLHDRLDLASKALSHIVNVNESTSSAEFVNIMNENFTSIGVRVSKSRLRDISNLGKFFIFLQNISAKQFEWATSTWIKELNGAVLYVEDSLRWYDFLTKLHQQLSKYDTQKNKKSYAIPILKDIPSEGLLIKESIDLLAFVDSISDKDFLKTINYEEIKKIRLDKTKIKFFNQVIQATLKDVTTYTCSDDGRRVQVSGDYILLSELKFNKCYLNSISVQILANRIVFVDASLKKSNDISIIAPRWEIIGDQSINLNGDDGPSHTFEKAPDVFCSGCNGEDGKPGLPGISAGHFFGIGSTFENIEHLQITATGGAGGPGQHAGDGGAGKNGETFHIDDANTFHCLKNQRCTSEIDYSKGGFLSLSVHGYIKHVKYGNDGGVGGNSGHYGKGGLGGKKGEIIALDISNSNSFKRSKIEAYEGLLGMPGFTGEPGLGGAGGINTCRYYNFGTWSSTIDHGDSCGWASRGYRGKVIHDSSRESPAQPAIKEFLHPPSLIVSDYRNQLIEDLHNCVKKRASSLFYSQLQNNMELDYNPNILKNELEHLNEHQHLLTPDTAEMLYSSILKKILKVADSYPEQRDLLKYLILSINAKFLQLQARPENHVNFDLLRNFQQKMLSPPEFPNIDKTSQFVVEMLNFLVVDNVDPITENAESQIIELWRQNIEKASDQQLSKLLLKHKLLGDTVMLTQFLGFLCLLAEADREVIADVSVDKVLPSIKFKPSNIHQIDKIKLQNAIFELESTAVTPLDVLRSLISTERKSYENSSNPRSDLVDVLRHIEQELRFNRYSCAKSLSLQEGARYNMKSVQIFVNILKDYFKIKDFNAYEMEMIERIVTHYKLIEFDAQLYVRVNQQSNMKYLVESFNMTDDSIDKLQATRYELIAGIVPILNYVRTDTFTGTFELNTLSLIRTSVMNFLDRAKVYLHGMLDQFEIDEDLQFIIENLESILNAISNLYETVASTEEEMRLISFWRAVYGHEQKQELRTKFLSFEYQRLIDTFKRSIFPFDILGLQNQDLPQITDFKNETQLGTNVFQLQSTLDTLVKTLNPEYMVEDYFNSTSQPGALYKWRSGSYGKNIAKLLRGGAIFLAASIDPNDEYEFLRYDSIRLHFQALNESIQFSLDEALGNFSVRLVHSGNWYNTFCNRIHLFNSQVLDLEYEYADETGAQVEPTRSPYTTWKFSLSPANENVTFSSLLPFADQPIDLELEGHARYLKFEDKTSICEQFDIGSMTPNYADLLTQRQPQHERKRRQVDSPKSWNPFAYFTNSQTEDSSTVNALEYDEEPSKSSNQFFTPSLFTLNGTLPLVDYIIRNITKMKPFKSLSRDDESFKFNQVNPQVLRIVDEFVTLCEQLSRENNVETDQGLPDPTILMSELEKPVVRGDREAVREMLRSSVHMGPEIEAQFDERLDQMLDTFEYDRNNHTGLGINEDPNDWVHELYNGEGTIPLSQPDTNFLSFDTDYNATLLH